LDLLKDRWAGLTSEGMANLTAVNEDVALRDESMKEFRETWTAADIDSDGNLSRDEFINFQIKHNYNIKLRIGWAPELTTDDLAMIWDTIHALDDSKLIGITMQQYGRYHACVKAVFGVQNKVELEDSPQPSGPVKWKLALVIFTCLYPTLITLDLILFYSGFYPNEDINGSIKLFCTAGLAVPTLVFVLLPFAMGRLKLGPWVNTNGANDVYNPKRNLRISSSLIGFLIFCLVFTTIVWPHFRWKK
jgi:hypothetical protein